MPADNFRKMVFIGQNLKHVHVTYSLHELLILVHIRCLEFWFIIASAKDTNNEIKIKRYTVSPVTGFSVKKSMFFMQRPKKVALFPDRFRVKKNLSLTSPYSRMSIRIYAFNFKKQTSKKKQEKQKKLKNLKNYLREIH